MPSKLTRWKRLSEEQKGSVRYRGKALWMLVGITSNFYFEQKHLYTFCHKLTGVSGWNRKMSVKHLLRLTKFDS